jgi:hypothetical protein
MWHVPLCVPTVIGPEVKTENRCRHLAVITHTSTFMQQTGNANIPALANIPCTLGEDRYIYSV